MAISEQYHYYNKSTLKALIIGCIAELDAQMGFLPPAEGACRVCHKPLQVGAEFCSYCGETVIERPKVCPSCATTTFPDAKWCPNCRTALP